MDTPNKAHERLLAARLDGIRELLMAHYRIGAQMPNAVKGTERETVVGEFLAKIFPSPFRFGSGAVTDASGSMSGQLDIVVEFPFFPSFPPLNGSERLYLAESVALAIEVKSDLTAQWSQVEQTVGQLRGVRRRWKSVARV